MLLVVDARAGVMPGDEELAEILRNSHKPVLVLANKIDDPSQETLALEVHRLGLGEPIPLSGMHGHGTGDLLDEIVERLEDVGRARRAIGDEAIRVAILGRPNVGKSSLFNKLVGEERTIVSEVPGTTRDSIDTVLERGDRIFQLVDTAGLRRKRKQRQGIEYYSELRALETAERADVALVLIDASEGIVEGDLAAADVARKAQCSTLVVLSKWDLSTVTIEDVRPELQRRLRQRPPIVTTSAKTGRGIARVLDKVGELYDKHAGRISTGELNRFLGELKEARQPPSRGRKRLNLLYGAQVSARPPRFRFTVNDTSLITRDYGYWVENELRARFGLEGVPVTIDFRPPVVRTAVVVGGGSWGTGFSRFLADHGLDVTLATRQAEDAAAIRETGRNPRFMTEVDLSDVAATTVADAPVAEADLVVVAVPSRAFRSVVESLPGSSPILSLTKGLDPATGDRLSTLVTGRPGRSHVGPEHGRGGRRRSSRRDRDRE